MSSVSTYNRRTRHIIVIDPYLFEWGRTVWGWTWSNGQCTFISFLTKVSNKCANTDLYFFTFSKNWQMIITSTVSPALKIGLQCLGIWPGVPYSTVYWLSFMTSIPIILFFQYWWIFEHLMISELANLMDALTMILDYNLTFFKLIGLWIHRR